jgi:threonine/homoserine/homoserine lactone efflux protein
VIPLALGAAVSPLVFLGAIAVMTGPRPLRHGIAYAIGVALPLLAVTVVALLLGRAFSLPEASGSVKAWIDLALGAVLLALGVRALRRPTAPAKPRQRAEGEGIGRLVAMGSGLMISNVTTFALYIPALKLVEQSGSSDVDEGAAIAVLLAITMLPVLVPLAVVAVAPSASERLLTRAGDWLAAHRRTLAVALCFGFGAYLVIKGLARL